MHTKTTAETSADYPLAQPHVRQMQGYVPGEQPQAGKFIKLNTNENPYPPADSVVRAIKDAAGSNLNLYPDPTCLAFRRIAAEVLNVEPDWIICGNGSDDILTILTRAFVGSGQALRMANPSYTLYRTLAQIQNAATDVVDYQGDWILPDRFFAPSSNVKLIYLANPNSPSGTLIAKGEIEKHLGDLTCPLVVDEAYGDFAAENCLELVGKSDKVIVTRSLSKSYSLAGLRFGFAVAQPQVIAQLLKVKDSYNCDRLSIAGATAAISNQAWFQETITKVKQTRMRLEQALSELGFQVTPSQANFVWCQHPGRASRTLYQELKEQQILVRYMSYDGWGDGIRITVGSDSQIDALLAVLKNTLHI